MKSWSITDKGIIRRQNQDAFFSLCDEERGFSLLIVCDGMGGAAGGDKASRLAVDFVSEFVLSGIDAALKSTEAMTRLMIEAAEQANGIVYRKSLEEPSLHGMGTTLVAALITKHNAVVANVGDSRAYRLTKKSIFQITRDHSVVEEMIERGELTREQARINPNKNLITRALGTEETVKCDVFLPRLSAGDRLLLCTDGLSNLLSDGELLSAASESDDLEVCCESLLRQSLARGAPDNITMTLFCR